MSDYPKIARICPYLDRLDSVMDGDFCRMCQRTVHDLSDMSGAERTAFMSACGGDACVKYTMRLSPAMAAAALAASAVVLVPAPALAQQRHRPKHAHVRPVRVPPPPMLYVTAGAPMPMPIEKPAEPPKVADPQPAVADRQPEAAPK